MSATRVAKSGFGRSSPNSVASIQFSRGHDSFADQASTDRFIALELDHDFEFRMFASVRNGFMEARVLAVDINRKRVIVRPHSELSERD
jgi:hypothetical protein